MKLRGPILLVLGGAGVLALLFLLAQPDVGGLQQQLVIDPGPSGGNVDLHDLPVPVPGAGDAPAASGGAAGRGGAAGAVGGAAGGAAGGGGSGGMAGLPFGLGSPAWQLEGLSLALFRSLAGATGLLQALPNLQVPSLTLPSAGPAPGVQLPTTGAWGAAGGSASGGGAAGAPGAGATDGGSGLGALGSGLALPADPGILLLAAVAALAVVAVLAARRWPRRRPRPPAEPGPVAPLRLAHSPGLDVEFPDIAPDLPLVWGVGDPPLAFRARGPPGAALRVLCDGEPCTAIPRAKGSHVIEVTDGTRRTQKLLRVVDYREEVVRAFDAFARGSGVDEAQWTAREVVREAVARSGAARAAERAVPVFEASKYDRQPVDRAGYVACFRAFAAAQGTGSGPASGGVGAAPGPV